MQLVTGVVDTSDIMLVAHETLIKQLYKSLVDIIIQSVESTTRDVREMLRLARMLWPTYIGPLGTYVYPVGPHDPSVNSAVSGNILEKLGQDLRPHIRQMLPQCLLRPGRALSSTNAVASVSNELPYLAKFMLLAAYLCQTNKADHDQVLYTNKRGGRKKKKGDNHSESVTHASSQQSQRELKLDRVTSFPLERMLSVFSSVCNKYAQNGEDVDTTRANHPSDTVNGTVNVARLGTTSLMKCLSDLRQCGLIHEASASATSASASNITDGNMVYSKSITSTKYTCSLSRRQAEAISKDLNFPLHLYLTENN